MSETDRQEEGGQTTAVEFEDDSARVVVDDAAILSEDDLDNVFGGMAINRDFDW